MDLILSLIPGGQVAAILAAIVAFFGWTMRQRVIGARKERERNAADRLKAREEADRIDDAIAGRDAKTNRDELKLWSPWSKR